MDSYTTKTSESLVMIWQALNQLNYTARQRGMKITIELRAFGNNIPWHYSNEQGSHEIVLDGSIGNLLQIQKILEAVKD